MEKILVHYKAGESRYSKKIVDYMQVVVDGFELYAETTPHDSEELATYEELREMIIWQAEEKGIDSDILRFWLDD